jgi:hypothetical protein
MSTAHKIFGVELQRTFGNLNGQRFFYPKSENVPDIIELVYPKPIDPEYVPGVYISVKHRTEALEINLGIRNLGQMT